MVELSESGIWRNADSSFLITEIYFPPDSNDPLANGAKFLTQK